MKSEITHQITFLCRIKQSFDKNDNEQRSMRLNDKRSISPLKSKSPIRKAPTQNAAQIFTTNVDNGISKVVVASENPIKQKHIQSFFRTEKDLLNYKNTLLKNSKIFSYDGVFDGKYKFIFISLSKNLNSIVKKIFIKSFTKIRHATLLMVLILYFFSMVQNRNFFFTF